MGPVVFLWKLYAVLLSLVTLFANPRPHTSPSDVVGAFDERGRLTLGSGEGEEIQKVNEKRKSRQGRGVRGLST